MRNDDVIAALNRLGVKGPRVRCPVCEANAWGGAGEHGGLHLQAIDADGQITPGIGLECAAMVCNQCGYVRLHATQVLERL
jgi:hypothetical protein